MVRRSNRFWAGLSLVQQDAPGPSWWFTTPSNSMVKRNSICQKYANYVMQHYGKAVVVFDGYDNGWATLTWRTREQMMEIHFMGSTIMNVKKDALLSNKKKLHYSAWYNPGASGCKTSHARGDADVLILQTTIQSVSTSNTVLVGDDTDLLILLCFHTPVDSSHEIYVLQA